MHTQKSRAQQNVGAPQAVAPEEKPKLPLFLVMTMGVSAGMLSAELVCRFFRSTNTWYDFSLAQSVITQTLMGTMVTSFFSIEKITFFTSAAVSAAGYTALELYHRATYGSCVADNLEQDSTPRPEL